jgi:hypothetical protein
MIECTNNTELVLAGLTLLNGVISWMNRRKLSEVSKQVEINGNGH